MSKQTETNQEKPKKAVGFTKKQFMKAANFTRIERDVLNALLEDGKTYTIEQAKRIIDDFKKGKVK